jgi:signal transduction histidine kinase
MKIDVVENIREDHLLPPSQAFHLFNVLQEAVNNAVRHSGGNQVTVTIESNASWKIVVADNGRGFNAGRKIDGNGVSNMKHRSVEAGWLIEWEPNVPAGTRLSIAPTTK